MTQTLAEGLKVRHGIKQTFKNEVGGKVVDVKVKAPQTGGAAPRR
jgi:hypothetical protein